MTNSQAPSLHSLSWKTSSSTACRWPASAQPPLATGGDSIHPDYDTVALQDVARLYAKYDALYKGRNPSP